MGKQWKLCQTLFFEAPKSLQMVTAAMKLKDAYRVIVTIFLNSIYASFKDGMGMEVGGGFRMGNTCKSMADSCVWQKPLQYCKVISFQLIKVKEKKMLTPWKESYDQPR